MGFHSELVIPKPLTRKKLRLYPKNLGR